MEPGRTETELSRRNPTSPDVRFTDRSRGSPVARCTRRMMYVKSLFTLVVVVVLSSAEVHGCYVDCPMRAHCQAYFDLWTGCSMCTCSGRVIQEVCPNAMICPRNCPLLTDSLGCFSCSCISEGFRFPN